MRKPRCWSVWWALGFHAVALGLTLVSIRSLHAVSGVALAEGYVAPAVLYSLDRVRFIAVFGFIGGLLLSWRDFRKIKLARGSTILAWCGLALTLLLPL